MMTHFTKASGIYIWKAMVYDIYLGLTSMEQKNNKVTFKTFEAKVPSYLQQKNNNAMSMSKRRTHEWYWEVTYVRDWISRWAIALMSCCISLCWNLGISLGVSNYFQAFTFEFHQWQPTLRKFTQRWTVIVQLQIWLWKKPFVEKR